jgi:zinc transport system substrate-binding protein
MKKLTLALSMVILLLSACSSVPAMPQANRPVVMVSVQPQAYFVQKIAGDLVEVHTMVGTGDDPHTYEPTTDQMRKMADAQLYFSIGVEFEAAWLPRFTAANPDLKIVDSTEGVTRISVSSIPNGEEKGEPDPHIWVSPSRVKQISANMAAALAELDPDNAPIYEQNLAVWLQEIDQVDADIRAALSGITRRVFLSVHPSWGYFAEAYGLQMLAVEREGQEPGPEDLAKIIEQARAHQITYVFSQKGVNQKLAQSIADQLGGAQIVELDPLVQNWSENMRYVAAQLAAALK